MKELIGLVILSLFVVVPKHNTAQWLTLPNMGQKVKIACTIFVCEPTTKLMVPMERWSFKYSL